MTVPTGAETASGQRPGGADNAPADTGPRPRPSTSARDAVGATCPYLTSSGGSWRLAGPSRDHRCAAIDPPAPQTTEKQRLHCLSTDHVECTLFRAARSARMATLAGGADPALVEAADRRRRPLARTAPILLEPPRLVDRAVQLQFERAPGQLALIGLMVVAFAIVALTRLSAGAGPSASGSLPPASAPLVAGFSVAPSPTAKPSASPSAGSAGPSTSAQPSFRTTYRVKKGDTLLAIAKRFGTTAARIKALNGLTSSSLKVGQVLKIP
jgi:LysM repeat protein